MGSRAQLMSVCVLGVAAWIRDTLNTVLTLTAHTRLEEAAVLTYSPAVHPVIICVCCLLIIVAMGQMNARVEPPMRTDNIPQSNSSVQKELHPVGSISDCILWSLRRNIRRSCVCVCSHQFKCCGVIYFTDWLEMTEMEWPPDSCCTNQYPGCARHAHHHDLSDLHQEGCGPKIYSFIRGTKQLQVLRFLGVSIGVAQILAMALTLTLLWALYCGRQFQELDLEVTPGLPEESTSIAATNGTTTDASKSGCGRMTKGRTETSAAEAQLKDPQVEMEWLNAAG
ncbi:hypothetical protein GOODEAATRI_016956 [Goodea atripinnis]|uniref:Tetraspanin-12 n=1 Tax=Goodea atripinnis TaxID=208336 RepID=A0ABV0PYN4_9TELE